MNTRTISRSIPELGHRIHSGGPLISFYLFNQIYPRDIEPIPTFAAYFGLQDLPSNSFRLNLLFIEHFDDAIGYRILGCWRRAAPVILW